MKQIFTVLGMILLVFTTSFTLNAKTLKLALDADPTSLDPHEQLSKGMMQYSNWVFDPLIRWDKDMQPEGRLATSWKQLTPTTLRIYLRKGVAFHSGNPFTSQDVEWTFHRLRKSPDFKGLFEPFERVKIINNYAIDFITKEPYSLGLRIAGGYLYPMDSKFYSGKDKDGKPKGLIDKINTTFAKFNASGTGKFIVTEREQGVKMVLKKYPNYWDQESKGNVDQIILTPIKSNPTRVAALLSGEVDFISPVPPQDFDRIRTSDNLKLMTMNGGGIVVFQLSQKRRPEFRNLLVRQAVAYAVNNEAIAKKIMKGRATPAGQLSPEGYLGHNEKLLPRYDLEKAKALMKKAGYENGFSVTLLAPNNRYINDAKIAEAVAGMLAKINIRVILRTMPKAQYWTQFDLRSADIMMVGWNAESEDSSNFAEFLAMSPNPMKGYGQYNSGFYSNYVVDALVLASQKEPLEFKRQALLQKIEQIMYEEVAFIPLHWEHLSWASKKNLKIESIVNPQNRPHFGDLVIE